MKNFTQKALMIVITMFVLVGLFYGLSTPVKTTTPAASMNPSLPRPHDGGPTPLCDVDPTYCPKLAGEVQQK
jgi:hypothetical protein